MKQEMSQQLLYEIQKIKERDYSSYQRFYEQTSVKLYGVIWETVQNKDLADALLIDLYNDIYSSIAAELTDNSQFYDWASNKARIMSFTYLSNPNNSTVKENNYIAETAAVISANVALESSASAAATGAEMAVAEGAGIGTMAGGYASAGMGATSGGAVASTEVSTGVLSTAAKVGLSLGAKMAIGIVCATVATGAGIAIYHHIDSKDKTEITTEVIEEITTEELIEEVAEETTEEITTEEVVDETTARYRAYYELVKNYMEKYPTTVEINGGSLYGLICVQLMDMENVGREQLIFTYSTTLTTLDMIVPSYHVDIYDYVGEDTVLVGSIECDYPCSDYASIGYKQDGDKTFIFAKKDIGIENAGTHIYEIYEYANGTLHKYKEYVDEFNYESNSNRQTIDGVEVKHEIFYSQLEEEKNGYDFCNVGYKRYWLEAADYEIPIMKTLLIKHNTIKQLMEFTESNDFINDEEPLDYSLDVNGSSVVKFTANCYNESYELYLNNNVNYNFSDDGKNLFVENWNASGPAYLAYKNGTWIVVGWKYIFGMSDEAHCYWISVDDYFDDVIPDQQTGSEFGMEREISEEEFNDRAEELMK